MSSRIWADVIEDPLEETRIRGVQEKAQISSQLQSTELRFQVGDRVECSIAIVGQQVWLFRPGIVSTELGNEGRGIEQISDGVNMYRTIYGSNHNEVSILEDCLIEVIDEGLTDQLDYWIINRW